MPEDRERALVLVVDTPNGQYVRQISDASALVSGLEQGKAAEHATQSAVARWGLPDFVFRPIVRRKGAGTRELGDALLLTGRQAVVIQVKSRHAPSGDSSKEERWIRKNVAHALRQAQGTIRSLRSASNQMLNLRDRQILVDGRHLEWLSVVIIDHPGVPEGIRFENANTASPSLVLLRRDWEFLFDHLRSTHAVVQYLRRVTSDDDPIDLGEEPVRYYRLAQADAEAGPSGSEIPETPGARRASAPLLPLAPAGWEDARAHMLLRVIMEDVALTPIPDYISESDRLSVLAEIDELPVGHRTELGQTIFEMMRTVADAPEGRIVWRFRRIRGERGAAHLLFGACSRKHDEFVNEAFLQWVILRHWEFGQDAGGEITGLDSVGILLTPRDDGRRPWDTTMVYVSGDPGLTADDMNRIREFWSNA
jgi:hypothetical protein